MRTAKATSTVQTVFALQDVEQLRGDLVTQVFQSLLQLGAVNAARSIAVKAGKDTLPVLVRYCQMLFFGVGYEEEGVHTFMHFHSSVNLGERVSGAWEVTEYYANLVETDLTVLVGVLHRREVENIRRGMDRDHEITHT